jgi:hypothetical protein
MLINFFIHAWISYAFSGAGRVGNLRRFAARDALKRRFAVFLPFLGMCHRAGFGSLLTFILNPGGTSKGLTGTLPVMASSSGGIGFPCSILTLFIVGIIHHPLFLFRS